MAAIRRETYCEDLGQVSCITADELRRLISALSNAMGQLLFTPAGVHEKLIQNAGFVDLHVEDVTDTIAVVS